ncbi:hypothetical protein C6A36_00045 [Desulfobacteraceae bacterium SEEP-SAG10]|nr:hypothetical protein C6A36_00045 [Desulfobacteraceae bacterium SEEP-SAG10]
MPQCTAMNDLRTAKTSHEIQFLDKLLRDMDYGYHSINSLPENKVILNLSRRYHWFGVLCRQLFRLSPVDLRALFGKRESVKDSQAIILLATAYLELWEASREKRFIDSFETIVEWIIGNRSPCAKNYAVPHRKKLFLKEYVSSGEYDISPLLTCYAAKLFLKAFHVTSSIKYLSLAISSGNYFVEELSNENYGESIYFYYIPGLRKKIYNCSAEISSFLVQLGSITGSGEYFDKGLMGLQFIANVQNRNGSWFYGESKSFRYIDNFHTAFILLSFYNALKVTKNSAFVEAFRSGLRYYEANLFKKISDDSCRPRHFDPRFLPRNSNAIQKVDLRDAALAIILFSSLGQDEPKYASMAEYVFNWTIDNMRGNHGYYCELTWIWPNTIPYIEFQAWMFLSISILQGIKCR